MARSMDPTKASSPSFESAADTACPPTLSSTFAMLTAFWNATSQYQSLEPGAARRQGSGSAETGGVSSHSDSQCILRAGIRAHT
eukprot:974479-Rhodomonas_salina.1